MPDAMRCGIEGINPCKNTHENQNHRKESRSARRREVPQIILGCEGGRGGGVMSRTLLLLALCATAHAAPPESFWRALHIVETSGRHGPTVGDGGKALGPLQIHRAYHADSRVSGPYERVADLAYSRRVSTAYFKRYAPDAWATGDVETLARIHNGGPRGASKPATLGYGRKVTALTGKK